MATPQRNPPSGGYHEGSDRRGDRDRSGGGSGGGPRWTFRAPIAVGPSDIAEAIAEHVTRAVVDHQLTNGWTIRSTDERRRDDRLSISLRISA